MDNIKKLIGIVAGLFCTLIMAWFCSFQLKIDFIWYNTLDKPAFLLSSAGMTVFVSVMYLFHILVIARLVTGKHFFPSMLFLAFVSIFSILFVHSFFTWKNIYLAFVFSLLVFIVSLITQVRFFLKELRISLYYLPVFIFNAYSIIVVSFIAFSN